MKPRQNWWIWGGLALVAAGLFSYLPIFIRFAATRDFPWVNLLLLAGGLTVMAVGIARAYRPDRSYRGRVSGPIAGVLAVVFTALFCWGLFFAVRELPVPANALRAGVEAPDFTLQDFDGNAVKLSALLRGNRAAVLVFYRGYW